MFENINDFNGFVIGGPHAGHIIAPSKCGEIFEAYELSPMPSTPFQSMQYTEQPIVIYRYKKFRIQIEGKLLQLWAGYGLTEWQVFKELLEGYAANAYKNRKTASIEVPRVAEGT